MHTILYVHCVDLLMWSPTKLEFSFYDFSMIYYNFSKDLAEIKKKDKTTFKTAYNRAMKVR